MRQIQVREVQTDIGVLWKMYEGDTLVGEFQSASAAGAYFETGIRDAMKGQTFAVSFLDVAGRAYVPAATYASEVHEYFPIDVARPAEGDKCAVMLQNDERVIAHYEDRRFVQINGRDLSGEAKAWVHANIADVIELERASRAK